MKLFPLQDHVIIKRDTSEDKSPGGIVLPDNAKEKPHRGKILAAGPGKSRDQALEMKGGPFVDPYRFPMDVKVGNVVLFKRYGGHDVEFEGETYIVISQDEILAIVEK